MATTTRNPLSQRARALISISPRFTKPFTTLKRPRSPAVSHEDQLNQAPSKRTKAAPDTPSQKQKRKDQQENEWRDKYLRAFPGFRFHFSEDIQNADYVKTLEKRIIQLGAIVEDFFSASVTHLIVKDVDPGRVSDKENRNSHKSPLKRERVLLVPEVPQVYRRTVEENKIKEWGIRKLDSVLSRCTLQSVILPTSGPLPSKLNASHSVHSNAAYSRSLNKLLQSEKIHGTTERDPTQKRHDYTYFSRGTHFVLVEDIRQELATIAAHQYMPPRRGSSRTPWPVLHCHPQSRGPFVPFDEREKRRWEKAQKMDIEDKVEAERKELKEQRLLQERIAQQREARQRGFDLRRSVSMSNLRRRESLDAEHPIDDFDSTYASGYLASGHGGYVAASGNSVSVTSTTGTTSTAGYSFSSSKLPFKLRLAAEQQVATSRKSSRRDSIKGDMGPPAVPEGRISIGLRRVKSAGHLKLPKREEGSKPGYCESCRVKFDDFKQHIASNRHRRFATNKAHFAELDAVLSLVKRKTVAEVEAERRNEARIDVFRNDSYDDHTDTRDVDLDDY
ncbi:hypothetical protein D9757_004313 [Collybiopsis confluens]|uniref:DBF4-type domain-containing protein n=1 Tax=Collybiopsis confluens TaxID=2823264 RepID=A0A8H5HU09_9AGAR|nr:hypothetical protein D9757_004313 [Collybiopsis confluens]